MWKIGSGLFLGWTLGANDSANIFGTGVATGTIRYRTAIWLTATFVMAGAIMEGPKCMQTLSELSQITPLGAFCCSLAAGLTMLALTAFAIPASSSQAIVGTIIGAGLLSGTADFTLLYKVIACWVFTPISGVLFGYLTYHLAEWLLNRTVRSITRRNTIFFAGILSAGCYGAYALGANNVANVTGIQVGAGMLSTHTASLLGGASIALGVLTYSKKVMMTIGKNIVPLDPFSAFVVVLAEAITLHIFTQIGVPVSSSQAVVGAVVGVGLVGDVSTVNLKILARIGIGWLMTPLSSGLIVVALLFFLT